MTCHRRFRLHCYLECQPQPRQRQQVVRYHPIAAEHVRQAAILTKLLLSSPVPQASSAVRLQVLPLDSPEKQHWACRHFRSRHRCHRIWVSMRA